MKKYLSKAITFILLGAMCIPQNATISTAAKKDSKKVLSTYASVLKKKKYINDRGDSSKPSFALADLNGDGVSELIISSTDEFMASKDYFMYKKGKAVKLKTPKYDFYPVFGTLYEMPSRGTYAFFRGGPAYNDEDGNAVMPHMINEYRLRKGKISLVASYDKNDITNRNNKKQIKYLKNGKKCSANDYQRVYKSFGDEITFVANTEYNRRSKGIR